MKKPVQNLLVERAPDGNFGSDNENEEGSDASNENMFSTPKGAATKLPTVKSYIKTIYLSKCTYQSIDRAFPMAWFEYIMVIAHISDTYATNSLKSEVMGSGLAFIDIDQQRYSFLYYTCSFYINTYIIWILTYSYFHRFYQIAFIQDIKKGSLWMV